MRQGKKSVTKRRRNRTFSVAIESHGIPASPIDRDIQVF